MAVTVKNYTINLSPEVGDPLTIHCSQTDGELKNIIFTLLYGSTTYTIPSGTSVYINGTKKNGSIFNHSCGYSGSTVTVPLKEDMTDTAGPIICELILVNSAGERLATGNFILYVENGAVADYDFHVDDPSQAYADYINTATYYQQLSKSYAVGGSGIRDNENTDNAKYYAEKAEESKDILEDTNELLDSFINNIFNEYTVLSGLYIDRDNGKITKLPNGYTDRLISIKVEPSTSYVVKKATSTQMIVASGPDETPTVGYRLTNYFYHNNPSTEALSIRTGLFDEYVYIQLFVSSDDLQYRTIQSNISTLKVIVDNSTDLSDIKEEFNNLKSIIDLIGTKESQPISDWVIGGLKESMKAGSTAENRCRLIESKLPTIPDKQLIYISIDPNYYVRIGVYDQADYSSLIALVADKFTTGYVIIPSEYIGKYIGFNVKKANNSIFSQEECDALSEKILICSSSKIGDLNDLLTDNNNTIVDAINEIHNTYKLEANRGLFSVTDFGKDYIKNVTFSNGAGSEIYTKTRNIMIMTGTRSNTTTTFESLTTDTLIRSNSFADETLVNPLLTLHKGRTYIAIVKFMSGTIAYTGSNESRSHDVQLILSNGTQIKNRVIKKITIPGGQTVDASDISDGRLIITPSEDLMCGFVFVNRGMISLEAFKIGVDIIDGTNLSVNSQIKGQDIIQSNEDALNMLYASNWWRGNRNNKPTMFNLLHYSDIHAGEPQIIRSVTLVEYLKSIGLLDDAICTGDIVHASSGDGTFSTWSNTAGINDIMITIGNHDTYQTIATPHGKITQAEKYAMYLTKAEENWGVVIEENASYYYKDYPGAKVRLIVVDPGIEDGTDGVNQEQWLVNTLAGAIEADYSVIVASHYLRLMDDTLIKSVTIVDSDWSNNFAREETGPLQMTYDWRGTDIVACVTQFITNGGKFICYLIGHTHTDILSYPTGHPDQLIVSICAASQKQTDGSNTTNISNDLPRFENTRTQDALNVITVDTSNNLLKCVRFGANSTMDSKSRRSFCWNYATAQMIGNL